MHFAIAVNGNSRNIVFASPPEPVLKIKLSVVDAKTILNKMSDLLSKYLSWEDNLSVRMHDWGLEANLEVINAFNYRYNDLQLEDLVIKKITELREGILKNPLATETLIAPVLDKDAYAWEESIIKEHIDLNLPSPFTGQPLMEYRSHDFAREMLFWVDTHFPLPNTILTPQVLGIHFSKEQTDLSPGEDFNRQIIIPVQFVEGFMAEMTMVESYRTCHDLWVFRRTINASLQNYQKAFKEAMDLIEERAREMQKIAEENEELLNRRIQQIEQTNDQTIDVMKASIQDVKKDLSKEQEKSEKLLQTCVDLNKRTGTLEQQLEQARQQIADLQRQGSHKTCAIQ